MTAAEYLLVNPRDGMRFDINEPVWRAPCGAPLMVADLPGIGRSDIDQSDRSLWRYRKAFPVEIENPVSLGEAGTRLTRGNRSGGG